MKIFFKIILSLLITTILWLYIISNTYKYSVNDCIEVQHSLNYKMKIFWITDINKKERQYYIWSIINSNIVELFVIDKDKIENISTNIKCPNNIK